ncbi:MAG: NADH:ubiquinone reductase (Na(+)-transporting) subunit B [Desulfobacteraceae bacterium]|nr:MAG: NADH:ubiquinone reductase (Na(+)-transporting) subunit B [Desulfobacteraceae bacterium]
MNGLKLFFDSQRRHFEAGGRLQKLYPLYESIETIFFAPVDITQTGPYVRDNLDVKRYMMLVIVALIPNLLFGIYNAGYQSHLASGSSLGFLPVVIKGLWIVVPLVIISYAVGFFWEILFAVVRKHEISEGLFVSAMLFPLILPPTLPWWQAALGISFGIVVGKEIFGGTGRNFLNPALTGRVFLYFAYPAQNSGDVWTVINGAKAAAVDVLSGATPLVIAAATETGTVEQALLEKGYSASRLFFGLYPDSIGASSALLCMLGAVFLIIVGVASYRIIVADIIGVLGTAWLLNLLASDASMPYLSLNPFYHLLMGGTAFGIAYMTTDPVTAPDMEAARWVYGIAIGALTVVIRVFNPAFPEGIMLSILFMNIFAPLLDYLVIRVHMRRRVPNV